MLSHRAMLACTCHPEPQLPPFLGPLHGLPMFPASLRLVPDEQRRDPACGGCAEISGRVVHAALAPPDAEGGQLPVDGRTRQLLSFSNAQLRLTR